MNKEEIKEQVIALTNAKTCCQEAKDAANAWLEAIGSEKEQETAQALITELEEDIMPIDQLIAFAGSPAGEALFGAETAKGIVAHADEIKANGA